MTKSSCQKRWRSRLAVCPALEHLQARVAFSGRLCLADGLWFQHFRLYLFTILLYLFGRYEQEANKHAMVENDFVVLKKVRVGISCSISILAPSVPRAQSCPGEQGVGELNAEHAILLPAGVPREMGQLCRHRDPRAGSDQGAI